MFNGRDRGDIPYIFPINLRYPDVRLVYLDLNHWISLSKYISGHKHGPRYRTVFDACVRAVRERNTEFPISFPLMIEIQAIRNRQQRLWLSRVMERLSRWRAVLPRNIIAALEFEQVLTTQWGDMQLRTAPLNYVGNGVGWTSGRRFDLTVVGKQGRNVTKEAFSRMPPGLRMFFTPKYVSDLLTKMIIKGPANHSEEEKLRANGWKPETIRDLYNDRVRLETQLVSDLDEYQARDSAINWRKGRLRDVVAARELVHVVNETFSSVLSRQRLTTEEVFDMSGTSNARRHNRRLTDVMPTFDVAVTLKASYHRNPNHRWKRNDLFDIDALSTVVPYCDIVLTDKAIASHLDRSSVPTRLNTNVLSHLDDLAEILGP